MPSKPSKPRRRRVYLRATLILALALLATAAFAALPIVARSIRLANSTSPVIYIPDFYRLSTAAAGDNITAVHRFRSFAYRSWSVQRERPAYESMNVRTGPSLAPNWTEIDVPWWAEIPPAMPGHGQTVSAFGWPLPCVCFRYESVRTVSPPPPGALSVDPVYSSTQTYRGFGRARLGRYNFVLPQLPIWPNLLFNLAFFALLLSMLLSIPAFRRALRRRRGHCPYCNYNLVGLPLCPECGPRAETGTA